MTTRVDPTTEQPTFLGWYDPDAKRPARQKLAAAIGRYIERHGRAPTLVLTSPVEADALTSDPDAPTLIVRGVAFVPRHTFYVGSDGAAPVPAAPPVEDRDPTLADVAEVMAAALGCERVSDRVDVALSCRDARTFVELLRPGGRASRVLVRLGDVEVVMRQTRAGLVASVDAHARSWQDALSAEVASLRVADRALLGAVRAALARSGGSRETWLADQLRAEVAV